MKTKNILATTTAAIILTAGTFAMAQGTAPGQRATPPATERAAPPAAAPSDQAASLAPGTLHEIKGDTATAATAAGLNISAKDLSGMDVYGSDGKKIGDVKKVLGDNSNSIKAVTMDVGGFLGIGSREVVLPIDKVQKGTEKDRLQVSMSKDDIQALKQWEDADRKNAPPSSPPGTTR